MGKGIYFGVVDHQGAAPPIVIATLNFAQIHRFVVVELFERGSQPLGWVGAWYLRRGLYYAIACEPAWSETRKRDRTRTIRRLGYVLQTLSC